MGFLLHTSHFRFISFELALLYMFSSVPFHCPFELHYDPNDLASAEKYTDDYYRDDIMTLASSCFDR